MSASTQPSSFQKAKDAMLGLTLDEQPETATTQKSSGSFVSFLKRKPLQTALGGVFVLLLVVGSVAGYYLTQQAQDVRQQASQCTLNTYQCDGQNYQLCTLAEGESEVSWQTEDACDCAAACNSQIGCQSPWSEWSACHLSATNTCVKERTNSCTQQPEITDCLPEQCPSAETDTSGSSSDSTLDCATPEDCAR